MKQSLNLLKRAGGKYIIGENGRSRIFKNNLIKSKKHLSFLRRS
jgi:hypothetical protein